MIDSPAPAKNVERLPCGCQTQEFADGRKVFAPCVPCGLGRAAYALSSARRWWRRGRNLEHAAQALAAVASTLIRERERINLASKVAKAMTEANKDDETNE